MNRPLISRVVRPLVAIALTVFALWWQTNPGDVWRVAAHADLSWIGLALLLVAVDRLLNAYRWLWLLQPIESGHRPPTAAIVRVFFTSTFAGTFLPGTVGGDLVRAYGLTRLQVPAAAAAASVAMDRLLGVLSLVLAAGFGLVAGGAADLSANVGIDLALAVIAAACAFGLAVVFSDRAARVAQRVTDRLPFERVRALSGQIVQATRAYGPFHRRLAFVLVASMAVQALRMLQAYCLGRSLAMAAPFSVYVAFLPLILLVVLLPISINGIGTSQAAFPLLFARVGTPNAEAFALSVLFLALGVAGNLPGGLLYAVRPARLPPRHHD